MTGTKTPHSTRLKLPFWATLLTCLGVVTLSALGTWQIQRLQWKTEILDKLETAYQNPQTNPDLTGLSNDEFIYASLTGRFLFEKSILLGHTIRDEKPGQTLITPLATSQGTILVNMGFFPNEEELNQHTLNTINNKQLSFTGIIRQPKWNSFTPQNVPEKNIWYRADINQIADNKALKNPLPFMLYADASSQKIDPTLPNNTRWKPNNNHGQYAIFWFTLAAALIIIYVLRFLKAQK